ALIKKQSHQAGNGGEPEQPGRPSQIGAKSQRFSLQQREAEINQGRVHSKRRMKISATSRASPSPGGEGRGEGERFLISHFLRRRLRLSLRQPGKFEPRFLDSCKPRGQPCTSFGFSVTAKKTSSNDASA